MKHYIYFYRSWKFIPMIALWFEKMEFDSDNDTTVTVLEFWIPFFYIMWRIEVTPRTPEVEELLKSYYGDSNV